MATIAEEAPEEAAPDIDNVVLAAEETAIELHSQRKSTLSRRHPFELVRFLAFSSTLSHLLDCFTAVEIRSTASNRTAGEDGAPMSSNIMLATGAFAGGQLPITRLSDAGDAQHK